MDARLYTVIVGKSTLDFNKVDYINTTKKYAVSIFSMNIGFLERLPNDLRGQYELVFNVKTLLKISFLQQTFEKCIPILTVGI